MINKHLSFFREVLKALNNAYIKLRHTIQMTNDRSLHILNFQWQPSIHFNWPMVGQCDVIFYMHFKKPFDIFVLYVLVIDVKDLPCLLYKNKNI